MRYRLEGGDIVLGFLQSFFFLASMLNRGLVTGVRNVVVGNLMYAAMPHGVYVHVSIVG